MTVLVAILGVLAIEVLVLLLMAGKDRHLHSYEYREGLYVCRRCGCSFRSFMD
jgi:hypothetical protein